MISPSYRIENFVDAVKDKNYVEIIILAENEVNGAERKMPPHVKGATKARREGGYYVAVLKGFLFFMKSGIKRSGIACALRNSMQFSIYKGAIEKNRNSPQLVFPKR